MQALAAPKLAAFWSRDFGSADEDLNLIPCVLEMAEAVRGAYQEFHLATDTLVTKVILGTVGSLPACDRFFIAGFKMHYGYSRLNTNFVNHVVQFCRRNIRLLREEQTKICTITGIRYPLMKLVDMYFHIEGREAT